MGPSSARRPTSAVYSFPRLSTTSGIPERSATARACGAWNTEVTRRSTSPIPSGAGVDAPAAGSNLYIKDLVQPPDPLGPYGTYAYGLSGSSNDFESFASGRGVVALHGTEDPAFLGQDVDRGSIALDAATVANLVETIGLPLGTPVQVVDPEARSDG